MDRELFYAQGSNPVFHDADVEYRNNAGGGGYAFDPATIDTASGAGRNSPGTVFSGNRCSMGHFVCEVGKIAGKLSGIRNFVDGGVYTFVSGDQRYCMVYSGGEICSVFNASGDFIVINGGKINAKSKKNDDSGGSAFFTFRSRRLLKYSEGSEDTGKEPVSDGKAGTVRHVDREYTKYGTGRNTGRTSGANGSLVCFGYDQCPDR